MVIDFDDPEVSERINISGKVPVSSIERPEKPTVYRQKDLPGYKNK